MENYGTMEVVHIWASANSSPPIKISRDTPNKLFNNCNTSRTIYDIASQQSITFRKCIQTSREIITGTVPIYISK